MKRDFTEATKTEFINLVQETNESEWLKKKKPLDNVDDLLTFDVQFPWNTLEAYYRKMIDKNDMTVGKIKEIWENVQILDATYQARFLALNELAIAYKEKLRILSDKIKPENIVNTLYSSKAQLQQELLNANNKINIAEMKHDFANINFYKSWLCDSEKKYNWELIEKYLNGDIKSISEEEYMAFIMILGDMNVKDLEKFANKAYIGNKELGYAKLSPFFIELSKRYSEITAVIAQSGMLDYTNQEQENLKNHCTISAIISCICRMKDPGTMMHGKYVAICWEEECKKYIVKLTHTDFINYDNPLGVAIESNQNAKRNKEFEIYIWCDSKSIEGILDDSLILRMGNEKKTNTEALTENIVSLLFSKGIEEVTASSYMTMLEMITTIDNNQETNIKIDADIESVKLGNYVEALYMEGNLITENKSDTFILNKSINKKMLSISIHLYNQVNSNVTIQDLISGLNSKKNVNLLDKYSEWYGKPDSTGISGKKKVEEYYIKLNQTWNDVVRQYPDSVLTDFENLSERQLKELMNKVDNPIYQVDYSVLEEKK